MYCIVLYSRSRQVIWVIFGTSFTLKVAFGQVSLQIILFFLVTMILPLLHTHSPIAEAVRIINLSN